MTKIRTKIQLAKLLKRKEALSLNLEAGGNGREVWEVDYMSTSDEEDNDTDDASSSNSDDEDTAKSDEKED